MSGKSKRGFASMDAERQKEIASKGGRAAHAKGTAHEWSRDDARNAGRKGGEVVSRDRAHMAAIGREGGEARGRSTSRNRQTTSFADRESALSVTREGMPPTRGLSDRAERADREEAEEAHDGANR